MSHRRSLVRLLGVALLATPFVAGAAAPASAATAPAGAYAESYGLLLDMNALDANVPLKSGPHGLATSTCPLTGGTKTAEFAGGGTPAVAQVDLLTSSATADCAAKSATATTRVVNVDALGAAVLVHADVITSTSTTTCAKAPVGSTQIAHLTIGGTPVPVPTDVPANTVVADPALSLLGLKVILNEQHPAASGRGLVVNGVHVIASGTGTIPVGGRVLRGDLVIAHAVSGVVCPGGPGSDLGGLPKPDITFAKSASPSSVQPGGTVTYTAVVTNQSSTACEVLKLVDHVAPAFTVVSSAGPFGTKLDSPAPARTDGGSDAILRPTGVILGAGKSLTQTFTVKVKDDAKAGTYYDMLEIYCGPNGDFVSGPLAPVTVTMPVELPTEPGPVVTGGSDTGSAHQPVLAATGLSTQLTAAALLLLIAAAGVRRLQFARRR